MRFRPIPPAINYAALITPDGKVLSTTRPVNTWWEQKDGLWVLHLDKTLYLFALEDAERTGTAFFEDDKDVRPVLVLWRIDDTLAPPVPAGHMVCWETGGTTPISWVSYDF